MFDTSDFAKKQIICHFPMQGEKITYKNDNIVILDGEGKIKAQSTCYRLFAVFVIGDTSITTGLLRNAKKFGFAICFFSYNMKLYSIVNNAMEGNTILHKKQYGDIPLEISNKIIYNKILNERQAINHIRNKVPAMKEAIEKLDGHLQHIENGEFLLEQKELLGTEGSAARTYFPQIFNNVKWTGRKPRIKHDYINVTLDIGYTVLFNFIDGVLQIFGFDVYCGVLHTNFYMRKSLVCDMMEPFRGIIDMQVRKSINLGQIKEEDFTQQKYQWTLNYKENKKYMQIFLGAVLEYKDEIFLYIQTYYRWFMKGKSIDEFPQFLLK